MSGDDEANRAMVSGVECRLCGGPACARVPMGSTASLVAPDYVPVVYRCPTCRSQFLYPPAPPGWLERFFSASVPRTDAQRAQLEDPRSRARYRSLGAARARWLAGRVRGGRVLDIGCGPGYLLAAFREMGWQTLGIDPNPLFVEFAGRELSVEVLPGSWQGVGKLVADGSVDLLTILHLLHMVEDPQAFLRSAIRKLRPGGFLFVELGNEVDNWRRTLWGTARRLRGRGETPLHYALPKQTYPTSRGLAALVRRAGVRPLYLGGYFPPVLTRTYARPTVAERFVAAREALLSRCGRGSVLVMLGRYRV
ncbi:MAG: class I SAM-dependent methyltransferase [Gemmatimonadetes bacterium]|nr:class I SAM-dependent methyltransferase [Gemmatimonadota bacterium]